MSLNTRKGLYTGIQSLFVKNASIDINRLPQHIAIIMDGNGRWAKRRGLSRSMGHKAGAQTLQGIAQYASEIGIRYLTVYAFSTENWKRPKEEVDALMDLLYDYLCQAKERLIGKDNRIRVVGDISALTPELQEKIQQVEEFSAHNQGMTLNIALNYGSRDELVHAVKKIAAEVLSGQLSPDAIDEACISRHLYTAGTPDPDLIIRPSGELRLSNFLLWQAAYSEFWFSNICWPDFTPKHLNQAIAQYQKRNRRFGGV